MRKSFCINTNKLNKTERKELAESLNDLVKKKKKRIYRTPTRIQKL